jgi:uncharacterized membrane protein YidH (DUF202 family)
MTRYDADGRNPEIAGERTDLAWSHSALSLLALGAVILRGTQRLHLKSPSVAIGIYVLVLGALTSFLGAWHTYHTRRRRQRPTTTADLATIAWGVAAIGIAAFLISAFEHP